MAHPETRIHIENATVKSDGWLKRTLSEVEEDLARFAKNHPVLTTAASAALLAWGGIGAKLIGAGGLYETWLRPSPSNNVKVTV